MKTRWVAWLWAGLIAGSAFFAAGRLWRRTAVDTSLLSLLPAAEGDPLLTQANALLSQRASRLIAFVIGHHDPETAADLGQTLNEKLKASPFVRQLMTDLPPEQQKAFYDIYFPFRYQMLSPDDRRRLREKKPLDYFVARLTGSLYSPAASFLKNIVPEDPFLFFPELIRSWMESAVPHPAGESQDGIAFVDQDGISYVFAAALLAADPFDTKNQEAMMGWLTDLRKTIAADSPDSHLYVSGVLPFASAERLRTEREMTMVSLGSLVGLLAMTALLFASLRAILLAAFPILVGFVVAGAATLLCFGKIHIITLAFGSSLIGVAIDYPLLYLALYRTAGSAWDAQSALRQVLPGLLLGAATTLLGYVALSFAPFPGLRQMALFSSVGLSAALITVVLWLPSWLARRPEYAGEPRLLSLGQSWLGKMRGLGKGRGRGAVTVILLAVVVIIIGGFRKLRFDDDIRRLQSPPASVAREDEFVRRASNGMGGNRFILVRGDTVEDLLRRQERLQERLRALLASGDLSSIQSLAPFLPSRERQEEDRRLLQKAFLTDAGRLRQRFGAIGLAPGIAAAFLENLSRPLIPFSIDAWLASPASEMLRSLWIGSTAHGFAAAALVGGLSETDHRNAALKDLEGVRFFDQVEEYSNLFRRYRRLSLRLMIVAYLGVWGLMMVRYGPKAGTLVTAPSVGAVLFTFAFFGWCGVKVQLIHCLSALLVLSMGVDYTIYFAEGARAGRPIGPTLLAVSLCAFSALLSFGLLALCRTPVLASIGITVFPGMALAFLLSPLPYWESAP